MIPAADIPQFSTAEYAHIPGTERCRLCNNPIAASYFRVNGLQACEPCASQARDGQPRDSHVAFTRGLLFGAGAALLGLIGYAAFTIITGLYVGYIALGVGWLVAKAIKKGSNGLGGRRYQVAAVILTYAAISLAAVPIDISYVIKHAKAQKQAQASSSQPGDESNNQNDQPRNKPSGAVGFDASKLGAFALQMLFVGLASPFLELTNPIHGAIGLFILFIGLRVAWQLTATSRLIVEGPYASTVG